MKKSNSMDVLYGEDQKPIDITEIQKKTQQEVISKFRETRKAKKVTQVDISRITGIPQPNITRFESDKSNPTLEMLVKMAAALNMKVTINLEELNDNNTGK